ncbi:Spc98 family-domain-containing protein [Thermothelomyces heterothallicus CBS 202.75]|uniref:Spc98 family-domain-containing protein n=1 Tax=Thermothelomyces heterothallicus CBS 202.75 TaxID=1149848 RepID=UPI0037421FFB
MADEEDPADLFAVPDLWRSSTWLNFSVDGSNTINPLFSLQLSSAAGPGASENLIETDTRRSGNEAVEQNDDVFFKLPSLLKELAGQEVQLQTKTCEPGITSIEHPELEPEPSTSQNGNEQEEDFWLSHDNDSAKPVVLRTWESFEQPEQEGSPPLFISEAGPTAFDALLASSQGAGDVPDILDAGSYCACLLNLALGRSSVLFSWDSGKNSFVKTVPFLRISGLSLDSVKAVDSLCLECGNSARHLQSFSEETYSAASTPTRIALAGVVGRLVAVVRSELSKNSDAARSVLQLQSVVRPAQSVLSYFRELVKKLAHQESDEGLLSCLFQEVQASEYRDVLLKEATREVLRVVSKPWTDLVEEWIGLRPEEGDSISKMSSGKGFIRVADKMWINDQGFELEEADYFFDRDRMPTFIPGDMAQSVFEAGRNLRFLREHHPEHPLSRPDMVSLASPPPLEWEFDWEAVSMLEAKVKQYRNAVLGLTRGGPSDTHGTAASSRGNKRKYEVARLEYFGRDESEVEANLFASIRQLDQPPPKPEPQDELTRLLRDRLYRAPDGQFHSNSLSPHGSLVPLLSFGPVIEAQTTLINHECMKLLFSSHHLRLHIDLLKQYFLLGNGLLVSRLTHALFDPDLSTAERRSGVALGGGTMGLRLGGRKTWPPASSELRLALMGVLSECYEPTTTTTSSSSFSITASTAASGRSSSPNLPGDLSFAVRDLSPQEIDRCMDPHSLEALDFLRLSYKPPRALRPVITPTILSKYDRIFKLLLRVLRMLYVANYNLSYHHRHRQEEESNAARRFRVEARHFIHQVAAYFFDVGIGEPWARFGRWLDAVQAHVQAEPGAAGQGPSVVVAPGAGKTGAERQRPPRSSSSSSSSSSAAAAAAAAATSPDVLRERQERVLDEIMGALFLRKRQAPVMGLLEEAFGVVLRFARATGDSRGARREGEETARELYRLFRKKVEVFITVCKGLGEKMAVSNAAAVAAAAAPAGGSFERGLGPPGTGRGDGARVEQLLLRLDMAGFYGRDIGRR